MTSKTLLIRNTRGNYSLRLLYEYFVRNNKYGEFGYLDVSNKEYFPPNKVAPILLNSKIREKIISRIFFKFPISNTLQKILQSNCKLHKRTKGSLKNALIVFKLLQLNNSIQLTNFCWGNVPYGKFVHTTLIAKYGVKHFRIAKISYLKNFVLFWRFLNGFSTTRFLLTKYSYTCVVLINGRDAVGVGAQLACYLSGVQIKTLEQGFILSKPPTYSVWEGNMHHWKVRENAVLTALNLYAKDFSVTDAKKFLMSKYGITSKYWTKAANDNYLRMLTKKSFVTFFTTSEKETTTCPDGIKGVNCFDEFDQTDSLIKVYSAAKELGVGLVVRLHPNFLNNKIAKNELEYFQKITEPWENTLLIPNHDATNSYKIAELAITNFSYRSTISAELSMLGISCFHTAQNAWSFACPGRLKIERDEIIECIKSKIEKNSHSLDTDFYAFACYMSNHSSKFLSLDFTLDTNNDFQTFIDGQRIDIPRFNFFKNRN